MSDNSFEKKLLRENEELRRQFAEAQKSLESIKNISMNDWDHDMKRIYNIADEALKEQGDETLRI